MRPAVRSTVEFRSLESDGPGDLTSRVGSSAAFVAVPVKPLPGDAELRFAGAIDVLRVLADEPLGKEGGFACPRLPPLRSEFSRAESRDKSSVSGSSRRISINFTSPI